MKLVVGAVIVDDIDAPTNVLAAERSGRLAGWWEFPGGKVEVGESPESALVREIAEELGVVIDVIERIGAPRAIDGDLQLSLHMATLVSGAPEPMSSHEQIEWLDRHRLDEQHWLAADREFLPEVRLRLGW